jgi:propionate CoA-transferase
LEVVVDGGRLRIAREGKVPKFVGEVGQRSFSAARARANGQRVLYVTERAVFRTAGEEIELVEVAPGIDIRSQILDLMGFTPKVGNVVPMAAGLFSAPA